MYLVVNLWLNDYLTQFLQLRWYLVLFIEVLTGLGVKQLLLTGFKTLWEPLSRTVWISWPFHLLIYKRLRPTWLSTCFVMPFNSLLLNLICTSLCIRTTTATTTATVTWNKTLYKNRKNKKLSSVFNIISVHNNKNNNNHHHNNSIVLEAVINKNLSSTYSQTWMFHGDSL